MAFVKSADHQVNRMLFEWSSTHSEYTVDEVNECSRDSSACENRSAGGHEANAASKTAETFQGNKVYRATLTRAADQTQDIEVKGNAAAVSLSDSALTTLHQILPDLMDSLYAYGLSLTKSVTETEDLVQETCLKVLSSAAVQASGRTGEFNWEAYLIRTARNTWIDSIRKQEKLRSLLDGLKPVVSRYAEEESFEELESAVQLLVSALPAWQRVIYILREMMGYTAAETAGMLGTTEGAVKAALNRARTGISKVRHELEQEGKDASLEKSAIEGLVHLEQEQLRSYLMAFRRGDTAGLIDLCLNRTDDPMAVAGTILQHTLPSPSVQPVTYGYASSRKKWMSYREGYSVHMAA
ncbi:RNA polymerase sigma factor [Paenibacillus sp. AN1007]|uniref:RNA polymerase sigma factor n=1 Tax=Paenibacillus sp. AN1007 TaxID=3151385 RepID=A0AAU8N9M5_9BACL